MRSSIKGNSVYLDIEKYKIGLINGSYKYKYIMNSCGRDELYNLKEDPKETKNLVDEEAEKAEEFKSKIREHILMEKRTMIDKKEKISKKIKELKSLGKI
jgi:K+/H+ antiporter YhaU regulatory subunit KhtT